MNDVLYLLITLVCFALLALLVSLVDRVVDESDDGGRGA